MTFTLRRVYEMTVLGLAGAAFVGFGWGSVGIVLSGLTLIVAAPFGRQLMYLPARLVAYRDVLSHALLGTSVISMLVAIIFEFPTLQDKLGGTPLLFVLVAMPLLLAI